MDIKLFRLQNGEDIISQFQYMHMQDDMPAHYKLTIPLKVVYFTQGMMGTDKFMVSLLPWVFTSLTKTKEFIVMPRDILTMAEPSDKLDKYYLQVSKKIEEMFEEIPMANEETKIAPDGFSDAVEDELNMMDENESHLGNNEFADMLRKALDSPSSKKGKKGTLH